MRRTDHPSAAACRAMASRRSSSGQRQQRAGVAGAELAVDHRALHRGRERRAGGWCWRPPAGCGPGAARSPRGTGRRCRRAASRRRPPRSADRSARSRFSVRAASSDCRAEFGGGSHDGRHAVRPARRTARRRRSPATSWYRAPGSLDHDGVEQAVGADRLAEAQPAPSSSNSRRGCSGLASTRSGSMSRSARPAGAGESPPDAGRARRRGRGERRARAPGRAGEPRCPSGAGRSRAAAWRDGRAAAAARCGRRGGRRGARRARRRRPRHGRSGRTG